MKRDVAIVLGCNSVGSAVAGALRSADMHVVMIDEADPPWPYRGMAFTDAWFTGSAALNGQSACFCASVRSVPTILSRSMIAATTWSWRGVAETLSADLLIDARPTAARLRLRAAIAPDDARETSTTSFAEHADVVTGLRSGRPVRTIVRLDAGQSPSRDDPVCIVTAIIAGRFVTRARIGDPVARGEQIAHLDGDPVIAPRTGVILGLPARGSRLAPGDVALHVDPRGDPARCHGIEPNACAFARKVVLGLGDRAPARPCLAGRGLERDGANA